MAEVLDLGRLLIQVPVSYQAIKNISVTEKQDTHGRLKLHLVLDSTQPADLSRLEQAPITVQTLDGVRVFCGVCTDYSTEQLGHRADRPKHRYGTDLLPLCQRRDGGSHPHR